MWSSVYAELLFTCTELHSRTRTDGFIFAKMYNAPITLQYVTHVQRCAEERTRINVNLKAFCPLITVLPQALVHICHHGTACSEMGKKRKKLKDKST